MIGGIRAESGLTLKVNDRQVSISSRSIEIMSKLMKASVGSVINPSVAISQAGQTVVRSGGRDTGLGILLDLSA